MLLITLFSVLAATSTTEGQQASCQPTEYDDRYPLTTPVIQSGQSSHLKYRIAIVSDLDKNSKRLADHYKWFSKMKKGWVEVVKNPNEEVVVKGVEWDGVDLEIEYDLSQKGRGMELSELKVFNGKLYSCDDKTGMVYELVEGKSTPIPFVRLNSADGSSSVPFKCEWMAVKDRLLYVGSFGREWMNKDGTVDHYDLFWVKTIDVRGLVTSHNWLDKFKQLRKNTPYEFPGYFTMEAAEWSDESKKWYFLPRKASKEAFDPVKDEKKGSNDLFITDENFCSVSNVKVGTLNATQGFSSFKFIPGTGDKAFLALKTAEVAGTLETYIGAYTVEGKTLMEPVKVANEKFEGLEFV